MSFIDMLASCDALVTKPGYGSFVEAAAHAVPVLYLPRADWPETAWLAKWIQQNGQSRVVGEGDLQADRLVEALEGLWAMPTRPPVRADGARVAARRLLDLFG